MKLEETQDKEDILILLMFKERDSYIKYLETENISLKSLLIEVAEENTQLRKRIKYFRRECK